MLSFKSMDELLRFAAILIHKIPEPIQQVPSTEATRPGNLLQFANLNMAQSK